MRTAPDMPMTADTPRAALLRAGLAALLMMGLLVFVLRGEEHAQAPLPEVLQPAASPPAVSLLLPPEPEPAVAASPEPVVDVPVEESAAPQPPAAAEPPRVPDTLAAPAPAPAAVAPKSPATSAPKAAVAPVSGVPHIVVLADFGPLPAARNMLGTASAAGHPARMLQRVQVGPFASREVARKAVGAGTQGIVIESAAAWWIQVGVFSDAENAERKRAELAQAGRQVVVHGRTELGPFATRAAAERALVEMRSALGQALGQASVTAVR